MPSNSASCSLTRWSFSFYIIHWLASAHSARFQAIYKSTEVVQVNLSALSGDMAVLTHHVPVIEPLKPGLLEVIEGSGGSPKRWFRASSSPALRSNQVRDGAQ